MILDIDQKAVLMPKVFSYKRLGDGERTKGKMVNNILDTALIFEGGGMRASYTSGILNNLLEEKLYFDYVAGISAGSSNAVNYLSRDINRAEKSFVDLVKDPKFGGWSTFFKGLGFFSAEYIYETIPQAGELLPFDWEAFIKNPARLRIGAFHRDTGKMNYFTQNDICTMNDMMKIVRASSSLPFFMPPAEYRGEFYVDGGLAGGIPLDIAQKDGLKKFFVVLSREKGYSKIPFKHPKILNAYYRKYPAMVEAMVNRHKVYNRTLEELRELESEGRAFLVYPDEMPVSSKEIDSDKLQESYNMGYEQGKRDFPRWREFLEI